MPGIGIGNHISNFTTQSYESESLAYFRRMTNPPSTSYKKDLNTFIKQGKTSGWYTKADIIRILFNQDEQTGLLNLIKNDYNATKQGAPIYNKYLGFTGADNVYLKSDYVFGTDNVKLTSSDACILAWNTRKVPTTLQFRLVGASTTDGSNREVITINAYDNLNKIRTEFGGNYGTGNGDYVINDNYMAGLVGFNYIGGNLSVVRNGVFEVTRAYTMTKFSTQEMYELGGRMRSLVYYWPSDYGFLFAGSSLTEIQHASLYNAVKDLFLKFASYNTNTTSQDLHIILGNSNVGRDLVTNVSNSNYKGIITGAKIYNIGYDTESAWNDLNAGVNTMCVNPNNSAEVGLESALAYNLYAYKNAPIRIFKHGIGSSNVYNHWLPSPAGINYKMFIANLQAAYVRAIAENIKLNLKSITIIHGENDADTETHANAYSTNHTAMITAIKSEIYSMCIKLGITYIAPKIIIVKMKYGTSTACSTIRTSQLTYVANPANNAILINTDEYSFIADNIHYTADSCVQMGIDIYNVIKDL